MLYFIYFFIVLILVVVDQYTKTLASTYMTLNQSIPLMKNFFHLTYVLNDGAGFSILRGAKSLFLMITPIALIIFVYLLYKSDKKKVLTTACYLMVIAGTIGNFIDRATTGLVVDFLDFYIFGYDFPIFNVADMYLSVGIFVLCLITLKEEKNGKNSVES